MKKPSAIELREYANEIGFKDFEPKAFLDHYQANGWKVGRASMKDWKAAVRTWKRMAPEFGNARPAVPMSKRNKRINELNERKASLLRMPDSPKVRQELERIRVELLDL